MAIDDKDSACLPLVVAQIVLCADVERKNVFVQLFVGSVKRRNGHGIAELTPGLSSAWSGLRPGLV